MPEYVLFYLHPNLAQLSKSLIMPFLALLLLKLGTKIKIKG